MRGRPKSNREDKDCLTPLDLLLGVQSAMSAYESGQRWRRLRKGGRAHAGSKRREAEADRAGGS